MPFVYVIDKDDNSSLKVNPDGSINAGLLDSSGNPINPATEDKQDDAITKLGDIETNQTDNSQKAQIVSRWGSGVGEFDDVRMDASTNSLQTVEYEHHEIHSGSHYFVVGAMEMANTNVLDFTWQMPATDKWTHWVWQIVTQVETNWYVYEDAIATNPLANLTTPRNNNRNKADASGTTMRWELQANLAGANADTDVATTGVLLESGISGAGKQAGQNDRSNELVLKSGGLYCLRALATAAGHINFTMEWYEHIDKH